MSAKTKVDGSQKREDAALLFNEQPNVGLYTAAFPNFFWCGQHIYCAGNVKFRGVFFEKMPDFAEISRIGSSKWRFLYTDNIN